MYSELWDSMIDILDGIDDKSLTIKHLHTSRLLNKNEVNVIHSTILQFQSEIIVRLVANKVHTGDEEELTRLATLMESHWALKFLFQYWKTKCKIHTLKYQFRKYLIEQL